MLPDDSIFDENDRDSGGYDSGTRKRNIVSCSVEIRRAALG